MRSPPLWRMQVPAVVVVVAVVVWCCGCCGGAAQNKPGGRRRGLRQEAQGCLRGLSEGQEELRGEVAALGQALAALTALATAALPEDCTAARTRGSLAPVVQVHPPGLPPRKVRCDHVTEGGGWTVVLARHPHPAHSQPRHAHSQPRHANAYGHTRTFGSAHRLDFNRSWEEYKTGFGDLEGEFWLGNEVVHALTQRAPHQLRVDLEDWKGMTATATWDHFRVASEMQHYQLSVDKFRDDSTAGNGLAHHHLKPFSTHDRDNDPYDHEHCGQHYGAGWWYFTCFEALLTGRGEERGGGGGTGYRTPRGIQWRSWANNDPLRAATMMIRPLPRPSPCPP